VSNELVLPGTHQYYRFLEADQQPQEVIPLAARFEDPFW